MAKYTVQETADRYEVTYMAVQKWIEKGLPYTTERVIGKKERRVLDEKDVEDFLQLKER
jgi:predicted site-specific integrase-resolvase